MASEMIERVARAEHDWDQEDRKRLGGYLPETFDELSDVVRQMRFDRARAAIAALREPTDGMVSYADDQVPFDGMGDDGGTEARYRDADDIWRAMIDAALGEGST